MCVHYKFQAKSFKAEHDLYAPWCLLDEARKVVARRVTARPFTHPMTVQRMTVLPVRGSVGSRGSTLRARVAVVTVG